MSQSTAGKSNTSMSGGSLKGGGLLLPNGRIKGVTNGIVEDPQLVKGFIVSLPFHEQGYEYHAYLCEKKNPLSILWFNKSQAFEVGKPIEIQVRPEEAARLKREEVSLYYVYMNPNGYLASGMEPYTIGTL